MNPEEPDPKTSDSEELAKSRLGRKPQVGGAIAIFLGVLLLAFIPASPAAKPDIHQMARVFIGIGILLIAVGTLSRWYFLD